MNFDPPFCSIMNLNNFSNPEFYSSATIKLNSF